MNIRQLMKQAQQMQEKMQRELDDLEIEASVGGGMVSIVMNGKKHVRAVKLDPEVVDPEDTSMLEDLILAAFNEGDMDQAVELLDSGHLRAVSGLVAQRGCHPVGDLLEPACHPGVLSQEEPSQHER